MCCSTNLAVILLSMQASKRIPFDDPTVLNGIRAMYVLSNLIIAGIYFYIQTKINAKKGVLLLCLEAIEVLRVMQSRLL